MIIIYFLFIGRIVIANGNKNIKFVSTLSGTSFVFNMSWSDITTKFYTSSNQW